MIFYDKDRDGVGTVVGGEEVVERGPSTAQLLAAVNGAVASVDMIAVTGELKAKVTCVCGGSCSHVMATCLDCRVTKQIHSSDVKAFEREHVTQGVGIRSRTHAVIVSHSAPSTDGLAGRRVSIQGA